MTPSEDLFVSLREYLETRLDYERQITDHRFELQDRALKIQADEYERRLEKLNGEHEYLSKMQGDKVSQDIYEQFQRTTEKELKALSIQVTVLATRMLTGGAALGAGLVILELFLKYWR